MYEKAPVVLFAFREMSVKDNSVSSVEICSEKLVTSVRLPVGKKQEKYNSHC